MMYVFNEDAEAFAHKVAQQGYMKNATASWAEGKYKVSAGITEVIKVNPAIRQIFSETNNPGS
jgi:hypothetical protein